MKGSLHALQHNEQSIDLMFAPYGSRGAGGTMRPRRFNSYAALADFLRKKIGAREDAMQDFLGELASTHHGTMNEVWLPEEERLKLGL